MYKSFRVKNFRCFKDLEIKDLGRINLIAGKNNTGKTALMEAMYLLTKPMTTSVLLSLHSSRGLDLPKISDEEFTELLFHHYDSSEAIEIEWRSTGDCAASRELEISEIKRTAGYESDFNSHAGDLRFDGLSHETIARRLEQTRSFLLLEFKDEDNFSYSAKFFVDRPPISNTSVEMRSNLIRAQSEPGGKDAIKIFSKLDRLGQESTLLESLRPLEPRLSELKLSDLQGENLICGRVNGFLVPLKLMGEGVGSLCHILLTMISSPASLLFIDEIENGIHHSVQCKVWQAIGKLARDLNIQVFATTHSLEMIRAAHEAFSADGALEEFRFHRLYRDKSTGDIDAITYNEFSLDAAVSTNWEMR